MNTGTRNVAILSGPLASEQKIITTKHERKILRFRLNTPEEMKKKDGVKFVKNEYHNIVVYSQSLIARFVEAEPKIGDTVTVEGSVTYRDYEIDGKKKHITEIVVTERNGDLRVEKESEKIFSENEEKNVDMR